MYFGCNVDVSGCEKLFDGEVNLMRTVQQKISAARFCAHLAIAPSLGSAWAISRFKKNPYNIISKKNLRKSLSALSVHALRLAPDVLVSLRELNVEYIGQLLELPRSALLARFGPEILKRIDQALGVEEEPLIVFSFPEHLRAEKVFAGPLENQEALLACAHKLLSMLLERLGRSGKKAAHLMLETKTVHAPAQVKEIVISVPTADYNHLSFLLSSQIEKIDMGLGVESLTISIFKTEEMSPVVENYLPNQNELVNDKRHFGNLLDILSERLGPERINGVHCNGSHIPEKSFSFEPFKSKAEKNVICGTEICKERPSVLFHFPSPAQVIAALPDSPPSWLKWRDRKYRIKTGLGPERIAPEWWGKDPDLFRTRDYFQVQLQSGTWLWMFRELETQKWFIQGIWC